MVLVSVVLVLSCGQTDTQYSAKRFTPTTAVGVSKYMDRRVSELVSK